MSDYPRKLSWHNTRFAGLTVAVGWLKREKFFRFLNQIPLILKTVKRSPRDKLEDLFVCLMTGVASIRQIDEGVRKDRGLALTLDRESLADQSLLSTTLDAFDADALRRLRANIVGLLKEESRALARIQKQKETVLDLDMTDLPCSARCEGSTKGRTTERLGSTVRQLSIVYNHLYREPLDVFLHAGNVYCAGPLEEIVEYLEDCYGWDRVHRRGIVWRLDAGYGSDQKLSWLMRRGYRVVAKGTSSKRAAKWAGSVVLWKPVGTAQAVFERERVEKISSPHRCLLVRTIRTKEEGYSYSYLVSNLKKWVRAQNHVKFYDARQGIEKEVQQIKSVLGLKHKRKHSFNGMEALALLTMMANLELTWFRRAIGLEQVGLKLFIEEVIKTPGSVARKGLRLFVEVEPQYKYSQILNAWHPQIRLPLFSQQTGSMLYKI